MNKGARAVKSRHGYRWIPGLTGSAAGRKGTITTPDGIRHTGRFHKHTRRLFFSNTTGRVYIHIEAKDRWMPAETPDRSKWGYPEEKEIKIIGKERVILADQRIPRR